MHNTNTNLFTNYGGTLLIGGLIYLLSDKIHYLLAGHGIPGIKVIRYFVSTVIGFIKRQKLRGFISYLQNLSTSHAARVNKIHINTIGVIQDNKHHSGFK